MRGGALFAIGLAVWAVSWFVSPHQAISKSKEVEDAMGGALRELEGALRELPSEREGPGAHRAPTPSSSAKLEVGGGGPPGWRAFRFSWDLLTGKEGEGVLKERILGLTGLTNLLMLAALLLVARGGRGRTLGAVLFGAVALNLSWLYLTDADFRSGLEAGYWMWVGSFALAGAGLVGRGE